MKLAFCLFKYFPYGGLQRDFLRIARVARERGHEVHVFASEWLGEPEPDFKIHILPVKTFQNHTKLRVFSKRLQRQLKNEKMDLLIGFNKIPHLDFYYAADVCFKASLYEQKSLLHRLLPRYRAYMQLEKSVFLAGKKTQIFLISPSQKKIYEKYYETEPERFYLLPPGISKDRVAPPDADVIKKSTRDSLALSEKDTVLLFIGSSYRTKGLDRAISAVAALPQHLREKTHLLVVGQDEPGSYATLAGHLGVENNVQFLGARQDVPALLLSADLLIHPARTENTGTVLLEALAAGLPVLTMNLCGYAHYITEANAGLVLADPFNQDELNHALHTILEKNDLSTWRAQALHFSKTADIYSLPEKAVDIIESHGKAL